MGRTWDEGQRELREKEKCDEEEVFDENENETEKEMKNELYRKQYNFFSVMYGKWQSFTLNLYYLIIVFRFPVLFDDDGS